MKYLSVWSRAFEISLGDVQFPRQRQLVDAGQESEIGVASPSPPQQVCAHNGELHELGSQFYESGECENFCHCDVDTAPEVACFPVKCPSKFGLDVINPFCLEWDEHEGFVPQPPMCCPPVPVCINDGSCQYKGHK